MTKLIGIFAFVTFLTVPAAHSEDFPDCWNTDGVVRGRYLIGGDLEALSKKEVIGLLDALQGNVFKPLTYLTLFKEEQESTFFVPVEHRNANASQDRDLQLKMMSEIQEILAAYKGTYAECDPIVMPK